MQEAVVVRHSVSIGSTVSAMGGAAAGSEQQQLQPVPAACVRALKTLLGNGCICGGTDASKEPINCLLCALASSRIAHDVARPSDFSPDRSDAQLQRLYLAVTTSSLGVRVGVRGTGTGLLNKSGATPSSSAASSSACRCGPGPARLPGGHSGPAGRLAGPPPHLPPPAPAAPPQPQPLRRSAPSVASSARRSAPSASRSCPRAALAPCACCRARMGCARRPCTPCATAAGPAWPSWTGGRAPSAARCAGKKLFSRGHGRGKPARRPRAKP